eukprot:gene25865-32374_t
MYLGLHQVLRLQFTDPVYPYPSPSVECQGRGFPITMLDAHRGIVTVQSLRPSASEMLYLTYPTQSNRKLPMVNLTVVAFVDDLAVAAHSLVIQSPSNVTITSQSCALDRSWLCEVSDGLVETIFVDSCRLECSLFMPFVNAPMVLLRLCRDH